MSLKSAHTGKLGKVFKNARILRSMTVEEIAHQTLISVEYIKAIESGDYAVFPARMFAVQYFKKYAKFLNLEIGFFDIYNADVVAAANKELQSDLPDPSFLKQNIVYFRGLIRNQDYLSNVHGPIQPIMINNNLKVISYQEALKAIGIHVAAVRAPTVPLNSSRLRVTIRADHTQEDIRLLASQLNYTLENEH